MKQEDIVRFSKAISKEISPLALSIMDQEDIDNFTLELLEDLKGFDEIEECKRICEMVGRNDLKPEQFRERILQLKDGREVWMGLRFFDRNPSFPMIECHKSWSGLTMNDFKNLEDLAKKEFGIKDLKGLSIYTSPDVIQSLGVDFNDKDQHWVVGRIDKNINSSLSFEKQHDMKILEDFSNAYKEYYEDFPELRNVLSEEDEEDIEESLESGHLYKLYLNDEYCGALAGVEDSIANQKAFYTNDVVIFRKFRGKGLGVEIQKTIHQIGYNMKYVYGTILNSNIPSLKTALRGGRKVLFGKYFLPF